MEQIFAFDQLSSAATDSFYVLDILERKICYVKPNELFLCGFSIEDALKFGYDFYSKIIFPDDLLLWTDMFQAVLRYLRNFTEKRDKVDFFSCTFRLLHKYSFISYPLKQMVYHQIIPFYKEGEIRYLLCFVTNSTSRKAGNLFACSKNGLIIEEYNLITKRWKLKKEELLTECERAVLMLARQGLSSKEIADYLHKGYFTIRNLIKKIFYKLNVHTMQEAVEYAVDHCLIHPYYDIEPILIDIACKRKRVLLTTEILQRIQYHLDNGESVRHTAKLEGISESAIRYWKSKKNNR